MEPLAAYRRMLTWFCVYPADENTPKWKKLARKIFCVYLFVGNVSGVTFSLAFILNFWSIDLESSLYAVFQISATGSGAYGVVLLLLNRQNIIAHFNNLSKIYEKYEDEDGQLAQANVKSEWLWKIYSKFWICGFFVGHWTVAAIGLLTCCLIRGHFDVKYLYHPYKTVFPWNQQTAIGYFAEIYIVVIFGGTYMIMNGLFITLFVSNCFHHQAFYEIFRKSVQKLDVPGKSQINKESLCKLIDFHITTKDWFLESASIFSPYIMIQLISSMILLSVSVFQMDLQLQHVNFNLCALLIAAISGLMNLFVYCYFGKLATECFEKMSDCLYEANWHEFPIDVKKCFILMIGNAQRPLYYHGFGIAVLNLQTFTKVLRTVYTYYMMFKTLTE